MRKDAEKAVEQKAERDLLKYADTHYKPKIEVEVSKSGVQVKT